MSKRFSVEQYTEAILAGDRVMLARAITLIESTLPKDQELSQQLLTSILPATGKSIRIGITGVPGVGKSTFIEQFGLLMLERTQKKLAVLAIDPSSSRSRGSILGDKTRMEQLSLHPKAYIRPSPAGATLGGTAQKTRETMLLCEAAGFEIIFVETVGVGQSETAVKAMTDFFLLLMLAGAGDELQGIKKGIMEMADMLVITKADGENKHKASLARAEYEGALHLFRRTEAWQVPVLTCSALQKEGLEEIITGINKYFTFSQDTGLFEEKRLAQQIGWFRESLHNGILAKFYQEKVFVQMIEKAEKAIIEQEKEAFLAAQEILKKINF
ncbi:MAG: methylmalonyl Co-A mutase-associated GTPase MeaB [Raineya sp.]